MNDKLREVEQKWYALSQELYELRKETTPEPVSDFELQTASGPKKLSELFGTYRDLIVVHNMGGSCNYCTLWADGYSGYLRHLSERTAFVVCSPDSPENQAKLAAARGWKFDMVCDASKEFTSAMGFWSEEHGWWPGVSAFHLNEDGSIVRTNRDMLGPGDAYCMVWPMFSLLKDGPNGWEPH